MKIVTKVHFGVDEASYAHFPAREIYVRGWCATSGLDPFEDLWAEVDHRFIPCMTGGYRPDLEECFGRAAMRRAGFVARFPIEERGCPVGFHAMIEGVRRPIGEWRECDLADAAHPADRTGGYMDWIRDHEERLLGAKPAGHGPLFSVVVRGFSSGYRLYRCVQSLLNQTYRRWELCLSFDSAPEAQFDPRIRWNTPPDAAQGDFVAWLDASDELHPCALAEIAERVYARARIAAAYTDEDELDWMDKRIHPRFKPALDFDVLARGNTIGRLAAVRASILRVAGGLPQDWTAAAEYDMVRRICEIAGPERIEHVGRPLYHRRPELQPDPEPLRPPVRRDRNASAAVILRLDDGASQRLILSRARVPAGTRFFEASFASVYPLDDAGGSALMIADDLGSEVVIFIDRAVDHVNQLFFAELITQSLRPDCGVVGGPAVDRKGQVVAGLPVVRRSGEVLDPARGFAFGAPGYMGLLNVVQAVSCLSGHFFATRVAMLKKAGGLARVRPDGMRELCASLVELSRGKGLKALYTPSAVAVLRYPEADQPWLAVRPFEGPLLNESLDAFDDPGRILAKGF